MQLTLVREPTIPGPARLPPEGIHVRVIEEGDLEAVGRLYYSAGYPDDAVDEEADAVAEIRASWDGAYGAWAHGASLLAEHDGALVAAVLTVDSPPWDDVADLVFIIDLFTAPALRGRGIAGALMRTALAAVAASREVGLRVDSENEPAVRLYHTLGFRDRTGG
jgi:[ribosomal protein S18]-alanine N-acetyltransferase